MGGRKPASAIRQRGNHSASHRAVHLSQQDHLGSAFSTSQALDDDDSVGKQGSEDDSFLNMWGTAPIGATTSGTESIFAVTQQQQPEPDFGTYAGIGGGVFNFSYQDTHNAGKAVAESHNQSSVMNYIKNLESRVDNLEKQNTELKAEVRRQNKHSGVSAKTAAPLSAATPEFKPTGPSSSSSSSSSPSVSQQYGSPAPSGSRNRTRSSATDNGNGNGGKHGSPGSSNGNSSYHHQQQQQHHYHQQAANGDSSLTKMHERLATLEGRQSSIQKKIACFDHVFGPSVGNWQRNVKEFLQRHVDCEGGEATRRSVSPILVHTGDDASAAGTKTKGHTNSSSSPHTTEETKSEEK